MDRSRLTDTRSAENDRIGADTDPEYRIDASLVEDSKNVRAVDTALDATSSGSPIHGSVLVTEPPQQGNWVTEAA